MDYQKTYPPELSFMERWTLDHIIHFCWLKGWDAKILDESWKWETVPDKKMTKDEEINRANLVDRRKR